MTGVGHERARRLRHSTRVEGYDAFVIGSAAYMFHWSRDATRFVKRNRALLDGRPVWLFSSGIFGAWDPESRPIGFVERLVRHLPAHDATPAGDFRDWDAIDAWATGIARDLLTAEARAPGGG